MEAKELRIGNIVSINNEKYWPEMKEKALVVNQIAEKIDFNKNWTHAISLDYINKDKFCYVGAMGAWICNVEPIKMNNYWKVRFGLREPIGIHNAKFSGLIHIEKCGDPKDLWEFHIGDILVMVFRYVHELQNMYFALTGKDFDLECAGKKIKNKTDEPD
jgi:hypothetical protein